MFAGELEDKLMLYTIALDGLLENSLKRLITKMVDLIDFLKKQTHSYAIHEKKCTSCGSL
ncbi:hypothetical protein C6P45_004012, partial [Maudiozyma exigua]